MKKFFTFIGAIAAGKGTQADIISKKYGFLHLSTGKIFRDAIESKTELGIKVKNIIDNGLLVPDDLTNALVKDLLQKIDISKGFILDGYPRTINQVKVLDEILSFLNISLDAAIMINIPDDEIVKRISGRFSCAKCGQNYHESFNKPKIDGICDSCGSSNFIRRNDDKEEIIRTRIVHYKTEIDPIVKYYEDRHKLFKIDATSKSINEVTDIIENYIK